MQFFTARKKHSETDIYFNVKNVKLEITTLQSGNIAERWDFKYNRF